MPDFDERLTEFARAQRITSKGALSLALCLTETAKSKTPPFSHEDYLTEKGGQVSRVSGERAQKILERNGVSQVLSAEGGRTSRGSIEKMRAYIALLNTLNDDGDLDFDALEQWWVERVRQFFASEPIRVRLDASKSLICIISDLMEAAFERQREGGGTMVAGAVMQHLVGAKLELLLPEAVIRHEGFSVADFPTSRKGDFEVGDAAIHVTTAPSKALLKKCRANLDDNLRPIIVTTKDGVGGAAANGKSEEISDRIEVFEVEQFLAANICEWSQFSREGRSVSIRELVQKYNEIVEKHETDPSLKVDLG